MKPIFEVLSSPSWTHLVFALLHSLWLGVLWAGALAVGLRICGNLSRRRYALGLGALAGLVLSTLMAWAVLETDWSSEDRPASTPISRNAGLPHLQGNGAGETSVARAVERPAEVLPWVAAGALIWLTGLAVMLIRLVVQLLDSGTGRRQSVPVRDPAVVRVLEELQDKLGLRRVVRLASNTTALVPSVAGVFAPTILLPASMLTGIPMEQFRAVFAHELAHIRRHDYLVNIAQQVVEALLFFNPSVWWINRQIRLEREVCCDALAVSVTSGPGEYAATLAGFAEQARGASHALHLAFPGDRRPSTLLERMRRLLVPEYQPIVRLPWYSFLAVMLVSGLLLLGAWRGSMLAVAMAAEILTAEQRIAKIVEIKAAQGPEERKYTTKDNIRVSGRVRTWDGAALPEGVRAQVSVLSAHSTISQSVRLTNGCFHCELPYGKLYICAGADSRYGPVLAGPWVSDPGGAITNIDLVLPKGFTSVIRVVGPANQPLAGVQLDGSYRHPAGWAAVRQTTDSKGEATLSNCVDLPMRWSALLPGFQQGGWEAVRLKENEPLVCRLKPARAVTGTIVSREKGTPVAGARIKLIHRADRPGAVTTELESAPLLARTDERGAFRLDSLPTSIPHLIAIEADGFAGKLLKGVVAGQENLRVELGPEIHIEGEIHGDLTRLSRSPDPRIDVAMPIEIDDSHSMSQFRPVPVRIENGVGRFSVRDLREGKAVMMVAGGTHEYMLREPVRDLVINIESPKTTPDALATRDVIVRFEVPPEMPPVTGQLKVLAHRESDRESTNQLIPVLNGEVRFTAPTPGWVHYTVDGLIGYWSPEQHAVRIAPDSSPLLLRAKALPAGAIFGRVSNSDGSETTGGVLVSVVEARRAPGREAGSLGDLGKQSAGGDDGPTRFVAQPLPIGGEYMIVAHRGLQYIASKPIALKEEEPVRELELRFVEGRDLAGTVTDRSGKPMEGVLVGLDYQTPYAHSFGIAGRGGSDGARTDAQGRFQFKGLNPNLPGSYVAIIEMEAGYQPLRQEVDFKKPLQLVLKPGASITGIVLNDQTGNPLAEAELYVIPLKVELVEPHPYLDADSKSDADGRFSFSKLDDREYQLFCREGGIINGAESSVKVRAGQTNSVVVRIKPHKDARLWELGRPVATQ